MPTQASHRRRNILILTVAVATSLAFVNFATKESRATYDIAASHGSPKENCEAKASKLMTLMEASAPLIH